MDPVRETLSEPSKGFTKLPGENRLSLVVGERWVVIGTALALVALTLIVAARLATGGGVLPSEIGLWVILAVAHTLAMKGHFRAAMATALGALCVEALQEFLWSPHGMLGNARLTLVVVLVFAGLQYGKHVASMVTASVGLLVPLFVQLGHHMGLGSPGLDGSAVAHVVLFEVILLATLALVTLYRRLVVATLEERDHFAQTLAEREALTRSITQHSLVPLLTADEGGRVERANPAAERLFGYPKKGMQGLRLSDLFPYVATRRLATTQGALTVVGRRKDRAEVPVEMATSVYTVGGAVKSTIALRDLTEHYLAQRQLTQLARDAGMAEVASDVLHSVGNALQSINTSGHIITETTEASRLPDLRRVVEQFSNALDKPEGIPAERLKKGMRLSQLLVEALERERRVVAEELNRLMERVEHVKHVVVAQQSMAKNRNLVEEVAPSQLLDDAASYLSATIEARGFQVVRRYQPMNALRTDPHRVLQILINLVKNACEAMDAEKGVLTLELEANEERGTVRWIVSDNGRGMSRENIARVFEHGFTTKSHGHGFGLHGCAIHARALGGTLEAFSEGEDKGARFVLTVPRHERERPQLMAV